MNRLDKIVTFKALGSDQLRRVLEIELKLVQQRIFNATPENSFVFEVTDPAKDLLLNEGTDMKYGARHLKRAIERLLVQPICSLIATSQVHGGDCNRVDWESAVDHFTFSKESIRCVSQDPCVPRSDQVIRKRETARSEGGAKRIVCERSA